MMRSMVGGVLTQKRSDRLDAGVRELLVQRELAEARFPMIKPISPLRQRMIDDMTMRNLSPSTQETCIRAVAQFSTFHRRSPDKLGVEHLRDYPLHLVSRGLTANSIWVKMGALRFFYRTTLRRPDIAEQIPMHWLFPGRNPSRPMTKRSLQLACRRAAEAAGLSKSVTVHTLRHSFATHLLEQGVDIRVIQDLLGHRHIKSTAGYARVAIDMIRQVQSPLELLNMAATTPEWRAGDVPSKARSGGHLPPPRCRLAHRQQDSSKPRPAARHDGNRDLSHRCARRSRRTLRRLHRRWQKRFRITITSTRLLLLTTLCASRLVNASSHTRASLACSSASVSRPIRIAGSRNCSRALKASWIGSQYRISWICDPKKMVSPKLTC